jgi:hypothetical protein
MRVYDEAMFRREPMVAVFLGIALIWGYATAVLAGAAGLNPLVAPASAAMVVAAFGWTRRGRDVVEVFAPALAVAYAAYVGLAVTRLSSHEIIITYWSLTPLNYQWPAALVGGIPFALIFALFVAVPVSWLPLRRRSSPAVEDRLGTFIKEYDAARARPRGDAPKAAS